MFSNTWIGNTDKAEFFFHECLKCAADVNDQMLPVYGMLGCAQVALMKQQVVRALTLVGAVQAVVERPGITLVPIVTQTLNTIMEQVNTIPVEQRDAGLNEGRKLHLDEAIQFAMDEKLTLAKLEV